MASRHTLMVVWISLLIGLLLAVFPMPYEWLWWRPEFIALLVIYWVLHMPQRLGVGFAFIVGLFQDIVCWTPWGQHALALMVVAYMCQLGYQRILSYGILQQSFWVFVLVGIHQLVANWTHTLSGHAAEGLVFLVPAVLSGCLWPGVNVLLGGIERHYRMG